MMPPGASLNRPFNSSLANQLARTAEQVFSISGRGVPRVVYAAGIQIFYHGGEEWQHMWHTEDGGPSYDRILEQFSALCGDVAYKVPHKISSPTQPLTCAADHENISIDDDSGASLLQAVVSHAFLVHLISRVISEFSFTPDHITCSLSSFSHSE
jgi:hypothetical protein